MVNVLKYMQWLSSKYKKIKKLKNHNIFVCIILFLYMYFQSSIFFNNLFWFIVMDCYLCVDKLKIEMLK